MGFASYIAKTAEEISAKTQSFEVQFYALITKGYLLEKKEQYNDALIMFEEARLLSEKGNISHQITALNHLAHLNSMQEELIEATRCYISADKLLVQSNDTELNTETNLQIGEFYRRIGKFPIAISYLEKVRNNCTSWKRWICIQ